MGSKPGSNYFEWAKAELEHRGRQRARVADPQTLAAVDATGRDTGTDDTGAMRGVQKTVFISYRRELAAPWARAIFQDLRQHGFDVFFDFKNIASGGYEEVIFENIKAKAHFLVLLTPNSLDRCRNTKDLFRREIEAALQSKRNVIPVMLDGFDFRTPEVDAQLNAASLGPLRGYNALSVYAEYFEAAMDRLRNEFLNVPLQLVLHPLSPSSERLAKEEQTEAAGAPAVTKKELRDAAQPRYTFTIKVRYQDDLERVEGTRADEKNGPGTLTVYDGDAVVARYDRIDRWSQQRIP